MAGLMLPSRCITDKVYELYEVASPVSYDELIVEAFYAGQLKPKIFKLANFFRVKFEAIYNVRLIAEHTCYHCL